MANTAVLPIAYATARGHACTRLVSISTVIAVRVGETTPTIPNTRAVAISSIVSPLTASAPAPSDR